MKKLRSAGLLLALAAMLTACGDTTQESAQTEAMDTMTISKDGSIENTIVEDFDKDYYSLDDLNSMIEEELTVFRKNNPTSEITLVSSGLTDDHQVQVTMSYDSAQTFLGYNGWFVSCDTVQSAHDSYDLDFTLRSAKDETQTIGKEELLELGERHIVMIVFPEGETDTLRLNCYGSILYMSDNVTLVSKKTVDITPTQETSVVVFK